MDRPLTLKDAAAFFVPLIFWAQMMMITHSVIHAWLARDASPTLSPTVSLAGFTIAFSFNALISSAFRAFHPISLNFIRDRRSVARIVSLGGAMVMAGTGFILLVALTPLGDWIFGVLLSASPAVVVQARAASLFFAWIFPLQMTRNVAAAILMLNRRTILMASGTLLRLISLGGWLAALSLALRGAPLGAAALVLCVAVEAVFVIAFALPFYRRLPAAEGELAGFGEIWRFAWPVVFNSVLENAMVVVINAFLGRLARPDEALAAFGVARGLLMVMMSPLRNLSQTAQALTRSAEDLRTIKRFTWIVIAGFTLATLLLFYTPLRGLLLDRVMGLPLVLREEMTPGILLFALMPLAWSTAALFRGLLAGARRTRALAGTGVVRLAAITAVAGLTLIWPAANGALVGLLALGAAFGSEALLLSLALRKVAGEGGAFAPASVKPGLSDAD